MIRHISTNGIFYIQPLAGSRSWYWGSDYCCGDLYEAEELFRQNLPVKGNRVILVSYPDGQRWLLR